MKQNGTITIQFVFRLRNQGDPSLHFHLTAWSRSLSLCRQWQKNSPRSLSVPKCGFITSNDFSTRQSLHWPEVGLNGLALVTRAQLMVKSASSTIPLSLRLQMYLERQVRPRWLGFYIYISVCSDDWAVANIFDLPSMDGNVTPEKARLQIDLQIATNGVSRQNRVVWSLCYWSFWRQTYTWWSLPSLSSKKKCWQ